MYSYYSLGDTGDEAADVIMGIKEDLLDRIPLPTSTWQSQDSAKHPEMSPQEIQNAHLSFFIPETKSDLIELLRPNLPWAEDHFQERVSGEPLNPPPSSSWWPYARVNNAEHKHGETFSHTYPERIWPIWANVGPSSLSENYGIRYKLGDLNDVILMLAKDLYTRQAFLPIWFPEDTGADDHRVPCTLGYHFRVRPWRGRIALHVNYYMRSCDIMRHMVDDLYLAARLGQFVRDRLCMPGLPRIHMGELDAFFSSLHLFVGDKALVERQAVAFDKCSGINYSHSDKFSLTGEPYAYL